MKTITSKNLNTMHLSDIYSLMLFVLYKIQDIPEYATLSEMCYLLDGSNITRLFTYFAGKTVRIPTEEEFSTLAQALLMYQYINIENKAFTEVVADLEGTPKEKDNITQLYLKIMPIIQEYNVDRSQVSKDVR